MIYPLGLIAQIPVRQDSIWNQIPGLWDLMIILAACGLIALMIWFVKASPAIGDGFLIKVNEEDVQFRGRFPAGSQAMVINFLRNDVAVGGSYEIRGRWDGALLAVVVKGENAKGVEQRIRNFLKTNLKAPGRV